MVNTRWCHVLTLIQALYRHGCNHGLYPVSHNNWISPDGRASGLWSKARWFNSLVHHYLYSKNAPLFTLHLKTLNQNNLKHEESNRVYWFETKGTILRFVVTYLNRYSPALRKGILVSLRLHNDFKKTNLLKNGMLIFVMLWEHEKSEMRCVMIHKSA